MRLFEARGDLLVCLSHPICPFATAEAEGMHILQTIYDPRGVYQ